MLCVHAARPTPGGFLDVMAKPESASELGGDGFLAPLSPEARALRRTQHSDAESQHQELLTQQHKAYVQRKEHVHQ